MKAKQIILIITLAFTMCSSCVVKLVPTKSPEVLALVQDLNSNVNSLCDQVIAAPVKAYSLFEDDYNRIDSSISVLIDKDKARKKSDKIVRQDINIQNYFRQFKSRHQTRVMITGADAKVNKAYLHSLISPRLISEYQTL